jgi:hypothetical protein
METFHASSRLSFELSALTFIARDLRSSSCCNNAANFGSPFCRKAPLATAPETVQKEICLQTNNNKPKCIIKSKGKVRTLQVITNSLPYFKNDAKDFFLCCN